MGIKASLIEERNEVLKELRETEVNSPRYTALVHREAKLTDQIIELEKQNVDKWNQIAKLGIDVVKYGVGIGTFALAFIASTNFEKEGTLTTEGGKTALRELLRIRM